MSQGTAAVSPSTTSTDASATRSSSATSIASPLRIPCPYSTFPAYAVTPPSGRTVSHRARCVSGCVFPYAPRA